MKPLNLDTKPCSPISSNCVVWQGPDIPCIKLCNGDTISDVVAALATELCDLLDSLDPGSYDLACLTTGHVPANIQELIQLLISKICSIEVIEGPQGQTGPPGPSGPQLFVKISSTGDIVLQSGDEAIGLAAEVSGGAGAVTYQWEIATDVYGTTRVPLAFSGITTGSNVIVKVDDLIDLAYVTAGYNNEFPIAMSLIKVIVTDSSGRKASDTYLPMIPLGEATPPAIA
jgi:hypothetical protein